MALVSLLGWRHIVTLIIEMHDLLVRVCIRHTITADCTSRALWCHALCTSTQRLYEHTELMFGPVSDVVCWSVLCSLNDVTKSQKVASTLSIADHALTLHVTALLYCWTFYCLHVYVIKWQIKAIKLVFCFTMLVQYDHCVNSFRYNYVTINMCMSDLIPTNAIKLLLHFISYWPYIVVTVSSC